LSVCLSLSPSFPLCIFIRPTNINKVILLVWERDLWCFLHRSGMKGLLGCRPLDRTFSKAKSLLQKFPEHAFRFWKWQKKQFHNFFTPLPHRGVEHTYRE
jgi:hypothetical protein